MDNPAKLINDLKELKKMNNIMVARVQKSIDAIEDSIEHGKDFITKLDRLKSFGETGNHKKSMEKLS